MSTAGLLLCTCNLGVNSVTNAQKIMLIITTTDYWQWMYRRLWVDKDDTYALKREGQFNYEHEKFFLLSCSFLMGFKLKGKACDFRVPLDSMTCDQCSVLKTKKRGRMLHKAKLTLAGPVKIWLASKLALQHA